MFACGIIANVEASERYVVIERATDGTPYVVVEITGTDEDRVADVASGFSRNAATVTRTEALADPNLRPALDAWDLHDDSVAQFDHTETILGRELDVIREKMESEERDALVAQGWDLDAATIAAVAKYEGRERAARLASVFDRFRTARPT